MINFLEQNNCPKCNFPLVPCKTDPDGGDLSIGMMLVCFNNECPGLTKYEDGTHFRLRFLQNGLQSDLRIKSEKTGGLRVLDKDEIKRYLKLQKEEDSILRYSEQENFCEMVDMYLSGKIEERSKGLIREQLLFSDYLDISYIDKCRELDDPPLHEAVLTILDRMGQKECPECASFIKKRANRCRFCGGYYFENE